MNYRKWIPWVLLGLEIFLLFFGRNYFDKILNPILFFVIVISLPFYLLSNGPTTIKITDTPKSGPWIFSFLSLLFVVLSFEEVRKAFLHYPLPTPNSDVLLQLETLYDRLAQHQFPYAAVQNGNYSAYPVYMPMHFLPIAITKWLHLDIRWCGFWVYAFATFLYGYQLGKTAVSLGKRFLLSLLPSIVLWSFFLFGEMDIFVTLEVLVAGYYLILATGLLFRNRFLITAGIVLCLLSRYTFVFWLPLLFVILWRENRIQTLFMTGVVLTALVSDYVIPFLMHDPTILQKGVAYHNHCAVDEWSMGFWTSEYRIHFAWLIHELVGENPERGVFINRVVQAIVLLLTLTISFYFYFYRKIKHDPYLYALAFLTIFMLVFFSFCPLTYRYYLISLLVLSATTLAGFVLRDHSNPSFQA